MEDKRKVCTFIVEKEKITNQLNNTIMNIKINLNSVVASVAKTVIPELQKLNEVARKEVVTLYFHDGICYITGKTSKNYNVPSKALKSGSDLLTWIEQRIKKAW